MDISNGPGISVSLFCSGCTHNCPGCFNPETHSFSAGEPFTDETTQLDIIKEIEDTIKKKGTKCIYTIYIEGEQYEAVPYQLEEIEAQYRVLEIKDQRKLAHDMNQLYEENKDNLLGKFIAKLGEDSSNELNQKALEYGMKALLDSMKY